MENSTTTPQTEQKVETPEIKPPKVKKQLPIGAVLKTIFVILILAGLGVGSYLGYKYVKRVDKDLSSIKKDVKSNADLANAVDEYGKATSARVDSLASAQAVAVQNNNYTYTPVYADITVNKVLEDKNSALESGFRFLLIDVTMVNNNATDVYFSSSELKLKDSDNYDYSVYSSNQYGSSYVKKDTNVLFPDSRLPLDYSSLKPGESVKGTIVYVLNRSSSKFKLYRNGVVLKDISL